DTVIATLSTGNPGRAYQILWELMQKYGGAATSASDEEAFSVTKIMAQTDGVSVEPATAVAFAGLIKMVRQGDIKPHDIVVFNCSGHTFPVEKTILGDNWAKQVDLSDIGTGRQLPETGIISALQNVGPKVKHVLIIEDNIDSARLLRRILETRGEYQVHVAGDGLQGLKMVESIHPDLIITDLMMPYLDGFQVIDTIKSNETYSHIPIIVITAKELTVKEMTRLNSQIDTLLRKGSFLSEDLLRNIMEALK
ncbi:MAG: pyridoxal-phosphate dependent enzyme, partial [Anaerolineae bacterium]|nr:pyridoxal-phosphate dependent enzyme [Anaerolineae bacterium]